jgi:hypothetical protein
MAELSVLHPTALMFIGLGLSLAYVLWRGVSGPMQEPRARPCGWLGVPVMLGPFAVGVSGDGAANGQHTVSVGGWGADDWPNQRQC